MRRNSLKIALCGIHTDIGKTIVSAVFVQALQADYWKPLQAGNLEHSDTHCVKSLLLNYKGRLHEEANRLQAAVSPHKAARLEGIHINSDVFQIPKTDNLLFIETAGGLLSPIDNKNTMADFLFKQKLPVFLVCRHYLGSINHTLLCLEVLKNRGIPILGLAVSGNSDPDSEAFISKLWPNLKWIHIPQMSHIDVKTINKAAEFIKEKLIQILSF